MSQLLRKKSLEGLMNEADSSEHKLKRSLGAVNLVFLGIGAIIGAGLFVRTAAAASEHAGPAVTMSFAIAAIGCAFAGLCYAEFASMIPIAGSAYTYAYATMGELVAWIIGWALILEYALGAATVSIAWSEYLNNLLGGSIPYQLCHSPFEISSVGGAWHYQLTGFGHSAIAHASVNQRHPGISDDQCRYCIYQSEHCVAVYFYRMEVHQSRQSNALPDTGQRATG